MPNDIKNKLTIYGTKEQVEEILKKFGTIHPKTLNLAWDNSIICRNNKNEVGWFNEITNIFRQRNKPDVTGIPKGFKYDYIEKFIKFPDFNKIIPQPHNIFRGDLGEKERIECEKKGIPNWYDWNCENWGTKWNSYCCKKISDNEFTWETAWAGVPNLMVILVKQFPEIDFLYEYADEDIGYNCGVLTSIKGDIKFRELENNTKESYELAFKLKPDYAQYYKFDSEKNTYVYNDKN